MQKKTTGMTRSNVLLVTNLSWSKTALKHCKRIDKQESTFMLLI